VRGGRTASTCRRSNGACRSGLSSRCVRIRGAADRAESFGIQRPHQRYTQDISNLLISGPYLYPDSGRQQISVALVEDDTHSNLQMPWRGPMACRRARSTRFSRSSRARRRRCDVVDPRKDDTLPNSSTRSGATSARAFRSISPAKRTRARIACRAPGARGDGRAHSRSTILFIQGVVRQYPQPGSASARRFRINRALAGAPGVQDLFPQTPLTPMNGLMEIVWARAPIQSTRDGCGDDDSGVSHACGENQDIGWFRRTYLAFFDPRASAHGARIQRDPPRRSSMAEKIQISRRLRIIASSSMARLFRACRTNPSRRSTA